jgi:hypothetical protein
MKVNREKFLAAAMVLSAATASTALAGCDKLGLKGKETATAAPESVMSATANGPAETAMPAPGSPAAAAAANHKNAVIKNNNIKVSSRPGVGPAKEMMGPGNENIAPNNENIAPNNENIAPNNENIAPNNENIAPANENLPTPAASGPARVLPVKPQGLRHK